MVEVDGESGRKRETRVDVAFMPMVLMLSSDKKTPKGQHVGCGRHTERKCTVLSTGGGSTAKYYACAKMIKQFKMSRNKSLVYSVDGWAKSNS